MCSAQELGSTFGTVKKEGSVTKYFSLLVLLQPEGATGKVREGTNNGKLCPRSSKENRQERRSSMAARLGEQIVFDDGSSEQSASCAAPRVAAKGGAAPILRLQRRIAEEKGPRGTSERSDTVSRERSETV